MKKIIKKSDNEYEKAFKEGYNEKAQKEYTPEFLDHYPCPVCDDKGYCRGDTGVWHPCPSCHMRIQCELCEAQTENAKGGK